MSDLVEVVAGTNPLDPDDKPRTHGDFYFEVPYEEDARPTEDTLVFNTALREADIYFALDSSESMAGELANLRAGFLSIVVPGVVARIPDVWFGVGRFEDCGVVASCANPCRHLLDVSPDLAAVQAALNSIVDPCGGREPYRQVLWLVATGDTSTYGSWVDPRPRRCSDASTIGWPCFRPQAVRIVIQTGDERMNESDGCSPNPTYAAVIDAMNAASMKYIGIASGGSWTLSSGMRIIAQATGSVDATTGEPLVFEIAADGTGLSETVVDAVEQMARTVPIRVDALLQDGEDRPETVPPVDAVTEFVDYVEANGSGAEVLDPTTGEIRTCTRLETSDGDGDGHPDYFPRDFPGTSVCWDFHIKRNVTVAPLRDVPRVFRVRVEIVGDLYTPLDARDLYFLVKPQVPLL